MDVSPDRLRRFFVREESGYGITKAIRDMVIFATQDVIRAPPFTRLDLVSCRNLLIYFEPELQNRLIPVFHYALKPGGVLFLSPSEGIGSHTDLFSAINRKFRVFQVKASEASTRAITRGLARSGDAPKGMEEPKKAKDANVADLTRKALLESYAPPSLLTDEAGNVLYVHGDTGRYLRMAPGQPSLNAIAMAREGLQLELRRAIHDAATKKRRVVCKDVPFKTHGALHRLNLTIKPLKEEEAGRRLLIVTFQDAGLPAPPRAAGSKRPARARESTRVRQIEHELLHTRKTLQATIDELQASSEDLKSMNEELQSTNEELQSTNQEIETSREELQSINEELLTVNAELQVKIELLTGLQNDMKNLLDNTNIGTIFLDRHLAIRRFSREAAVMFRLVASDVGRSLADIKSNVEGEDLVEDARAVLDSLVPRDKQVRTAAQAWYLVRILPYRTLENSIEGVVLTSTEITAMKRVEEALQQARSYAESLVDGVREPLLVLDDQLRVVSAGRSFYRSFGVTAGETVGRLVYELGERQWDVPKLREKLETILRQDVSFEDFEVHLHLAGMGPRRMLLNGRRVPGQIGQAPLVLLAIEDVTERAPGRSPGA
jgi:two-component system CheB/CheR fusion protein